MTDEEEFAARSQLKWTCRGSPCRDHASRDLATNLDAWQQSCAIRAKNVPVSRG